MKSKIFILITLVFLSVTSCEKFLEETPKATYSSSNFYTSEEGLTAGVLGVYDQLRNFYSREASAAMYLGTDEGATKWAASFRADFDSYSWSTEAGYLRNFWNDHYRIIMRANALIGDAPKSGVEQQIIDRIVGEARFLRALAYFRLVQMWGPVPILIGGETDEMPREPVGKVYEQIIQDMLFATQSGILPVEKSVAQPGRVTHYAAKTFLGKMYLTMASYKKYGTVFESLMQQAGKAEYGYQASITESSTSLYQKAEDILKDVIDNGGYELIDNYEDLFVIENKNFHSESIFEVQFSNDVASSWSKELGYPCWVPGRGAFPTWAGHTNNRGVPSLVLFYHPGDQRLDYNMPPYWIDRSPRIWRGLRERVPGHPSDYNRIINGTGNFYNFCGFGKYRWGKTWGELHVYPGGQDTPNNGIMTRFADVLLMYAEASMEANGSATQDGLDAINLVRDRARGFDVDPSETPEFPDLTLQDLTLDEIFDERVRELCIEHHRKFDLLRTGKLQAAIKTRRPIDDQKMTGPIDISDHRWLYPIPQAEIDIVEDKDKLWQNPGY